MYPVSEAFLESIYSDEVNMQFRAILRANGKTYNLGHADIVKDSIKITYRVLPGDDIIPGGICAADLAITLTNKDGKFNNVQLKYAEIQPFVDVETAPGVFETVPMGAFEVDTPDRLAVTFNRNYEAIPLQAADRMARFNLPFSQVNTPFPCTALQLLTLICQRCGVPLGSTNFMNSDYVIQEPPEGDISCRDVVSYIAEIAGCWAQCDRHGMLRLKWFKNPGYVQEASVDGNDPDVEVDGGDFTDNWYMNTYDGGVFREEEPDIVLSSGFYEFSIDDAPITITGVSLQTETDTYLVGSPRYVLALNNPLIQTDIPEVLFSLYEKLAGFTYIPFKGECIDNPALEAGDMVLLDNIEGKSHRTIITTYEYKFDGLCKIEATGTSEREHNCPPSDQRIYSRLIKAIGKKQQQLDALDLAIISATNLIASALGGYVIKGEGEYEGNLFIADNPDITQAVRVWRWNIGGFGYSDNGVDGPYETAITADKTIIANALLARIITGEMIKANSITGDHIQAETITGNKIRAGTITGDKLVTETVEASKLTTPSGDTYGIIGDTWVGSSLKQGLRLFSPNGNPFFEVIYYSNLYTLVRQPDGPFLEMLGDMLLIGPDESTGRPWIWLASDPGGATAIWYYNSSGLNTGVRFSSSGIEFFRNGQPHGHTENITISGRTLRFVNGILVSAS
jgi:hypothetical protein